ncbi:MAG: TolC family protein [Bdellovibrio sp.]
MSKLIKAMAELKKQSLIAMLIVSFLSPTVRAFEADQKSAPTVINSQTIKNFILSKNVPLMMQLLQVEQAKIKVNIARGNLLPSINLGALVASGPTFALSTISMLMPFLFPSNWLDLKQSHYLLNSQTKAYHIAKLNALASAYSLYLTLISDSNLRDVLQRQLDNYQNIEEYIRLGVQAGLRQQSELFFAHAQTAMASYQVSKVDELLNQEISTLRQMLALPLTEHLVIDRTHPEKDAVELLDVQRALELSISLAPEFEQLYYLEQAAKAGKWSQAFAFLSGGSLAETRSTATGNWNPGAASGQMSIGFSYYPKIQLSSLNIEQVKLQRKQMLLQQTQMVESVFGSIVEARKQVEKTTDAENSWNEYYENEFLRFQLGLTDLLHVLNAANNLTTALTGKIKSQNDLDNQRVTLNRLLLNREFRDVRPCVAVLESGKFKGNGFKRSDKEISIEKFCDSQK